MMSTQWVLSASYVAAGLFLCAVSSATASVVGDSASIANTFTDAVFSGGDQAIFGIDGPISVSPDEVEFSNFVGFYDIDIDQDSIHFTLVDNSGATDLIIPSDRFDRYYFWFDDHKFRAASLEGSEELNQFAKVVILDPGTNLNTTDPFGTGIGSPINFPNGGLLVEFGEGTDLTDTGVSAQINFHAEQVPEPSGATLSLLACLGLLTLLRRR